MMSLVLKRPAFCMLVCFLAVTLSCEGFQPCARTSSRLSRPSAPKTTSAPARQGFGGWTTRETSIRLFYEDDDSGSAAYERQRRLEARVNNFLWASHDSFQNVEGMTNRLLNEQPLLALAIFVGAGAIVAYVLGFIFLDGYIETWNPAQNDWIPYWDEEILIITRKVGR